MEMDSRPSLSLLTRLLSEPPDLGIVSDDASWKIVRENAARHGVAPLIAFIARPHVNATERSWCDRVLSSSWMRHFRSLQQLDDILAHLEDAGIQALVLKGPVLASRYYQPPFLRKPSSDLDLAIRREDLDRACDTLSKLGYTSEVSSTRENKTISHHMELVHPSRAKVELHFRLSHRGLGIPVGEFFERSASYELPHGRMVRILSPADELLHLILHSLGGRFATLFHLYEVRKIWRLASPETRRDALGKAAQHHFTGAFAMTDVAFRVRWGDVMITRDLPLAPTWLHWRLNPRLYHQFERCSDPGRELPLKVRLERKWLDFQMTDRPVDGLRFGADMLLIAWFQLFRQGWRTVRAK
jgi:Uncharacterised nucleotidyltransferase